MLAVSNPHISRYYPQIRFIFTITRVSGVSQSLLSLYGHTALSCTVRQINRMKRKLSALSMADFP